MSLAIVAARISPTAAAPVLLTGSVGLFVAAMAPRLWVQAVYGPICSGNSSLLHCPACWAAAVMAAAGLATALIQSIDRI